MLKRVSIIFSLFLCLLLTGCASKSELIEKNSELVEKNTELSEQLQEVKKLDNLLDFYNKITTTTVNSLVLVESTNRVTNSKLYSNGLVVANDSYYYYIVTDYEAIKQTGNISFRVLDASATVYNADIANSTDTESGLVLLRVDISRQTSIQMKVSTLGDATDTYANVSSINQINKVQVYEELKTSTVNYNSTSYVSYLVDAAQKGSILVNKNNEIFGIYLSKLNCFVSSTTLKAIALQTYAISL